MSNNNVQSKITIADVANALGISKTTVSRAISGKGRIGEETRKKVLAYIEANNYRPSPIAKGLTESKTYNICWAMPGDSNVTSLPFFQRCMVGISDVTMSREYDILISMIYGDNNTQLRRIVDNHKVDGVIFGRTLVKDDNVRFLKESHIPFVAIGSTEEEDVIQIDNDHIQACKELTSILVMKGIKRFALIGGGAEHVVNQTRRKGFEEGLKSQNIDVDTADIYMNCDTEADVERAVEMALNDNAECIICMDDLICYQAISKLHKENVIIPDQVKIASFYNSQMLENVQPAITSLQYDPRELGAVACKTLFDYMNGEDVDEKIMLSYEVLLKNSTQ